MFNTRATQHLTIFKIFIMPSFDSAVAPDGRQRNALRQFFQGSHEIPISKVPYQS